MSASLPDGLPHRHPFRLVERAAEVGERRVAIVLATANGALTAGVEWPLTLVAEALAQAILLVERPQRLEDLRLVALHRVAAYQSLGAGDRLEVEVEPVAMLPPLRRYSCRALRGGALAAVAEVTVSG